MPISEENIVQRKPFIFSHSGQKIGPDYPAISVEDIAVSLGRTARFAGHTQRFWPVLLHCMVVSDILTDECASGIGLLHDSAEALLGDIPTPFKNKETKVLENKLLWLILTAHLPYVNPTMKNWERLWKLVKVADTEAFLGEINVLGTKALRDLYKDRSPKAEKLVRKYLKKYKTADYLRPDGLAVLDYVRRVKDYQ